MTKALKLAKELSLPPDVVTQKINVLGQSGGGKTYLAMKLAELMLENLSQIVAIDLVGVWHGLLSSADGLRPGFSILVVGGENGHLPLTAGSGPMLADLVVDKGVSMVLDVSDMLEDEMLELVTAFIENLFQRKKRQKSPVHIFFEEAQELFPETPASKAEHRLRRVGTRFCKIGRNYGIGYTAITQEPQSTSKRVLNQAGTIFAVRTIGSLEREAIARTARSRATTKEQLNLVEVLPELETGEAIAWSPAWLKFAGKVRVLPKVTFDSSKTPEVGEKPMHPKVLAPVEIEQFRLAMASAVAEAEAQDPSALQRRVRQLEAELAARPPPAPPIEVKIPVLTEEHKAALIEVEHQLLGATRAIRDLQAEIGPIFARFHLGGETALTQVPVVKGAPVAKSSTPRRHATAVFPATKAGGLSKKGLEMVRELVALYPREVSRAELAARTLLRVNRNFRGYLKELRSAGLIEDSASGDLIATAVARKMMGEVQPKTSAALLHDWHTALSEKGRIITSWLFSDPGAVRTREEMAGRAGLGVNRNFRGYLREMRTAGLIEANGRGFVAGHALFLGER